MQPRKVVQDWRMPLLCLCPPADEMLAFFQHTFCIPASGAVVTDHSLDLFLVLQCCSICFYSPGCFGSLQSLRPCKDGAQGTIGLSFVSEHSWHLWNQRAWTMRPEERIEAPSLMAGFQTIILLHVLATARQCLHLAWKRCGRVHVSMSFQEAPQTNMKPWNAATQIKVRQYIEMCLSPESPSLLMIDAVCFFCCLSWSVWIIWNSRVARSKFWRKMPWHVSNV